MKSDRKSAGLRPLREVLADMIAVMPVTPGCHPTDAERDALATRLTRAAGDALDMADGARAMTGEG